MNKLTLTLSVLLLPSVVFAQNATNVTDVFVRIFGFINSVVIPFIFALAFIWFLWNIFTYFFFEAKPGNDVLRNQILFSVIGLFVMLSIWGIVALVQSSLGIPNTVAPVTPQIQGGNSTGGGSNFIGTSPN